LTKKRWGLGGSEDDAEKGEPLLHRLIAETVIELSRQTQTVLAELIPVGARVAQVDHPSHANVGDHAIWLGERIALSALSARRVYTCSLANYDRREIATATGDRPILIHGGGNLGDLWPQHEQFREDLIRDFPNNRIIQLTQSIHFDDPSRATALRERVKSHGGVTIMVRDRPSLDRAAELLGVDAVLCPDMAFALGSLPRRQAPRCDVLYLRRSDGEACADRGEEPRRAGIDIETRDWLECGAFEAFLGRADLRHPSIFGSQVGRKVLRNRLYDTQSAASLRRGTMILSRGRQVVTDRLHGFILSLLAGIPVIPLDNRTGKISAFISTWFPEEVAARWVAAARDWQSDGRGTWLRTDCDRVPS